MTDQTIPADEVRTIIAFYRDDASNRGDEILESLRYLLPPLPRPTLADMTEEERAACKWMQADVKNHRERYVIATPDDNDGEVALIDSDGGIDWIFPEYVTPRPDLPRMEWPSDKKPDPAPALPDGWRLAEHEKHGLVLVTNTTPNRLGNVYFVAPTADYIMGYDCRSCDPEELTYLEQ